MSNHTNVHFFVTAENKFHTLTSKDEPVCRHGELKALAADQMKIDIKKICR